jgi:demethoxyubiquinone hydroxylase (CLK1/Coq7/Cat5 family)
VKTQRSLTSVGAKRFSKSVWKSFKIDFKDVEEDISEAKNEVAEELILASEQEAKGFRHLMIAETEENRIFRTEHVAEVQANRDFRSQQMRVQQRTEALQIQKILKEEGTWIESSKNNQC